MIFIDFQIIIAIKKSRSFGKTTIVKQFFDVFIFFFSYGNTFLILIELMKSLFQIKVKFYFYFQSKN
jgi:hypothetical protein